jgi:hypothetical protein
MIGLITVALMSAPPFAALGQNTPAPAAESTREGDIYNFEKHQPTETPPSTATTKQVNDEVEDLLKQTDKLDKQFENTPGR